nr:Annexin D3 [Ipomoea batatas]
MAVLSLTVPSNPILALQTPWAADMEENTRQHIKTCGEGPLESILNLAIWCIDSPVKHFAEVVRASVLGLGTNEDSLTRGIVTRAESDLAEVRGEYEKITTSSSLDQAVADDTSGDYRDFLMALLGAQL